LILPSIVGASTHSTGRELSIGLVKPARATSAAASSGDLPMRSGTTTSPDAVAPWPAVAPDEVETSSRLEQAVTSEAASARRAFMATAPSNRRAGARPDRARELRALGARSLAWTGDHGRAGAA